MDPSSLSVDSLGSCVWNIDPITRGLKHTESYFRSVFDQFGLEY